MAMPIENQSSAEVSHQPLRLGLALSAITIGQLASSFGIQWYTVAQLGAGVETDALYAGATLPQVIMLVLIEPLGFVLVPMLAVRPERERRPLGWLLFGLTALLCVFIVILLLLLIPVVVPWLAPGFSERGLQLTVDLAKIQTGGVFGAGCVIVLSSLYQARQEFLRPALSALVSALLGWLVLIVGLRSGGVMLAGWVQVLNQSGPILFLAPCLGRIPRRTDVQFSVVLSELWRRFRPLLASAAYYRTGFVVDRFLTSLLAPGSVVILDLAWRIHTAFVRIVNQGVTTPLVPSLAALSTQGSWDTFNRLYRERLRWIALISLAAALGFGAATLQAHAVYLESGDQPIVGALRMRDLDQLLMALMASSGALLCGSMNHLFMSVFYALGETRAPAKIQMLTYSVGMVMKCFGFMFGGLLGIAVAISISYGMEGIFLGTALHRRLKWHAGSDVKPPLEMPVAGMPPRPL